MKKSLRLILLGSIILSSTVVQDVNADFIDSIKGLFRGNKDKAKNESNTDNKSISNDSDDNKNKKEDKKEDNKDKLDNKIEKKVENKLTDEKSSDNKDSTNPSNEEVTDKENIIVFNDGKTIKRLDILTELEKAPVQYRQRLNFDELMLFFALRSAYESVMTEEVKKLDLEKDISVRENIEKMQKSAISLNLLDAKVDNLMTFKELQKYYDEIWDKHIKGTKQCSVIVVEVPQKTQAEKIAKEATSEEKLNDIIKKLTDAGEKNIKTLPLDDFPESRLPPDVVKQIKGPNSIIGPFSIHGKNTLFFIKSISPAKKQPFNKDMVPGIKQVAKKDFTTKYVNSLIYKYDVTIYDLDNNKINPKEDISKNNDKSNNKKNHINLSKIADTQTIAKIGKITLKVKDLLEMFNIKSLDNELFGSMALQLKISMEEVIQSAIRLCVQDKLLELEVQALKYNKEPNVKKICDRIKEQQLRLVYFNKQVKITEADVKKQYNKYINSIKPEDKNDQEIATRIVFYGTKEDAEKALKEFKQNPKKFSDEFQTKLKAGENVLDLGYVRRQDSEPALWDAVKTQAAGTCCSKVLSLSGSVYGFEGQDFAVVHVGDRRNVKLPTYQETSQYFRKISEKLAAVTIVDNLLKKNIKKLDGKDYEKVNPEVRNRVLVNVITIDNENPQISD